MYLGHSCWVLNLLLNQIAAFGLRSFSRMFLYRYIVFACWAFMTLICVTPCIFVILVILLPTNAHHLLCRSKQSKWCAFVGNKITKITKMHGVTHIKFWFHCLPSPPNLVTAATEMINEVANILIWIRLTLQSTISIRSTLSISITLRINTLIQTRPKIWIRSIFFLRKQGKCDSCWNARFSRTDTNELCQFI
jgi:hypothetical protein